jgi:hypothetical protein
VNFSLDYFVFLCLEIFYNKQTHFVIKSTSKKEQNKQVNKTKKTKKVQFNRKAQLEVHLLSRPSSPREGLRSWVLRAQPSLL